MANRVQVEGEYNEGRARTRIWRSLTNIVVLVAIFAAGLAIGNGTITFGKPVASNSSLPSKLDFTEVQHTYDMLRTNFDGKLDNQTLLDGLQRGLVSAAGDPHTEFFNAKEAKQLQEQLSGTFSGIGAELGKDKNDNLQVVAPIAGFPAEKAGLRAQDIILAIDDETTSGMSIDQAVGKIRGRTDTTVKLQILRGDNERKDITITRAVIKVPSVEYTILPDNIGYIKITQFWDDTAGLVQAAAREFKQKQVTGVVLDLRSNPGGALDAAVDVVSVWLPQGKTILQEKRDGKVQQTFRANGSAILLGMPTRILIDEGSASASEIVAGALKDNNVAQLIGVKSYGKGSVQQIMDLKHGAQLKVTIARWYRPDGQNIDKKGIEPDTVVKMTEDDYAAGRDPQKDAAITSLR